MSSIYSKTHTVFITHTRTQHTQMMRTISLEDALKHTRYDIEENVAVTFCEVLGLPQEPHRYEIILKKRGGCVSLCFYFDDKCRAYVDCSHGVLRKPGTKYLRRHDDPDRGKDFSMPLITDDHRVVISKIAVLFRRFSF